MMPVPTKTTQPETYPRRMRLILRAFLLIVVLAMAVIALATEFGPGLMAPQQRAESAATLRQALIDLPQAEARWKAASISDYDVVVTLSEHPACGVGPALVHVRGGRVQNPSALDSILAPDSYCSGAAWLPGAGFATLRARLDQLDTQRLTLKVQFDPVYGFVTSFDSHAILGTGMSLVTLTNFQPISP